MKKRIKKYQSLPTDYKGNRGLSLRIVIVTLLMFICFAMILVKLVILQIIDHKYYAAKARKNVEDRHEIKAKRGTIYDRKGRVLARDILLYSVAISKKLINNKSVLKSELISNLNISSKEINRKLNEGSNFVYVAHKVPPQIIEKIAHLEEPGIILERKFLRVYPFKVNASHIIGFCDIDNNALGGIEYQYNFFLKGKAGWSIYQRDAFGNKILDLDYAGEDPLNGFNVSLTIDMDYQIVLDDELRNSVESFKATDGVAILMDPNTGEILALANYPFFDPNEPNHYLSHFLKNRAITDVFEPGSTFKIITLAAALEQLQVKIDKDIYFCENGRYKIYDQYVNDYKKFGWLTPRRIFENSSNIGTIKIAEKLKKETLYKYIRNFGFGMSTGIDLPGESNGLLNPLKKFTKGTHRYLSIGYEIGVTPIQLINAYAVLANNGKLMTPFMMKSISNDDGRIIKEKNPEIIRDVLSSETTQIMTDVLNGVVQNGTGQAALLGEVKIAGKTGTAQLYDAQSGKHQSNKHLASFIGFFPSNAPRFVLLVMIRHPKGEYYGGLVAAPAFRKMAKRIINLVPVKDPDFSDIIQNEDASRQSTSPGIESSHLNLVHNILANIGFNTSDILSDSKKLQMHPSNEKESFAKANMVTEMEPTNPRVLMPALTGLSLKEALQTLSENNLMASVEGHGIVIRQQPKAGSKIHNEQAIKLVCNPF